MRLHIVVGSTRPGRGGLSVAKWLTAVAKATPGIEAELVDLAEFDLPLLDEPNHPRLQNYLNEHTRRWSAKVKEADAFFFVTPEYNHSIPASLKNALDYLSREWALKPAAIASYAGISGGIRATQHLKHVMSALQMVAIPQGITIPNYTSLIDDNGVFEGTEINRNDAEQALSALLRWVRALRALGEERTVA